MNQSDFVREIANSTGQSVTNTKETVEAVFDKIGLLMRSGEELRINSFGIFKHQDKEARTGRNPMTGASVAIAAKRVPVFKASTSLKEIVNKPPARRSRR